MDNLITKLSLKCRSLYKRVKVAKIAFFEKTCPPHSAKNQPNFSHIRLIWSRAITTKNCRPNFWYIWLASKNGVSKLSNLPKLAKTPGQICSPPLTKIGVSSLKFSMISFKILIPQAVDQLFDMYLSWWEIRFWSYDCEGWEENIVLKLLENTQLTAKLILQCNSHEASPWVLILDLCLFRKLSQRVCDYKNRKKCTFEVCSSYNPNLFLKLITKSNIVSFARVQGPICCDFCRCT